MTYASKATLDRLLATGDLKIKRDDGGEIVYDGWDLALHVGPEAFVSTHDGVEMLGQGQGIKIRPGEFALLLTEEVLHLPTNVVGFISLKHALKARGLSNISGFHVDPGFRGRLMFSVYNTGPRDISLRRGEAAFMMGLSALDDHEGQDRELQNMSLKSVDLDQVRGLPVSVFELNSRLEAVERTWKGFWVTLSIIGGIASGLVVAFLAWKLGWI